MTTTVPSFLRDTVSLFPFQADGVTSFVDKTDAEADGVLCTYDTGLGKTALSIAASCRLFEEGKIDLVIVACERGKLGDWVQEYEKFSYLATHLYHGGTRAKKLAKVEDFHVVVSTYETLRLDLMKRHKIKGKRGKGTRVDGPLVGELDLMNKRVLWVLDECTKIKSRTSEVHQAFSYVLEQQRKTALRSRVLGLSATPLERDIEDSYNIGRIINPTLMPKVVDFEKAFTRGVDIYRRYIFRPERFEDFSRMYAPFLLKKRKTDADVIEQFPSMVEKSIHVEMHPEHAKFYDAMLGMLGRNVESKVSEAEVIAAEQTMFTLMRMSAGHPASHLHANNTFSRDVVDAVGEEFLRSIPSSKSLELISRLKPLVKGQGAQAIVFSAYGNSVIREVQRDLVSAGFTVSLFVGSMTPKDQEESKRLYLEGKTEIFLASDAGARGLNLGNSSYVFEYEMPLTYALHVQRINRAHRISSTVGSVTAYSMIAVDTLEEGIASLMMRRNEELDTLMGVGEDDEGAFVTAADRRALLGLAWKR